MNVPQFTSTKKGVLSDIAEIIMGQSPNGESYNKDGNGVPLINGPTEFGPISPKIIQWTDKPTKYAHDKDLLLCVRGSSIGRMNISNDTYCIGRGVAAIRPINKNINADYLRFLVQRNVHKILKKSAGSTFPNLSSSDLKSFPISIPNLEIQQLIGDFLSNISKKIQLQQQKIDLLQEQKKGFLQKMFPKAGETQPEMRFEGFAGDWEVYKWVDTVDISTNMVDPKNVEYDEFLHIGPGNIESFTGRILDNVNTVKEDNLISGKFHFKAGDIIYGKINPQLAKYTLVDFEGLASADAYILNAKNGINQQYLYTILQGEKFYKYSVSVSMRTGMPKINRDELNQYNYLAPNLKEQQKIGEFFKGLDNKIEVQKRKLQLLQKQKQGFMQQMFI